MVCIALCLASWRLPLYSLAKASFILILVSAVWGCQAQTGKGRTDDGPRSGPVGGGCDGCELYRAGLPNQLDGIDTSTGWTSAQHKLVVKGTVYHADGSSPAGGMLLYYWQTNEAGYYEPIPGMVDGGRLHGGIRGWMKTGADGRYALYTNRPGPYPGATMPAHIHIAVKEPDLDEAYYIDDIVFDDDPRLTAAERDAMPLRGGMGMVSGQEVNGVLRVKRDIVLGMNIPFHPEASSGK
jgi:protocatechuate 3,4-dioxygenase beta subunit